MGLDTGNLVALPISVVNDLGAAPTFNEAYAKAQDGQVDAAKDDMNSYFAKDKKLKRVDLSQPQRTRYLRFTALSAQNGGDYASGAEMSIIAD